MCLSVYIKLNKLKNKSWANFPILSLNSCWSELNFRFSLEECWLREIIWSELGKEQPCPLPFSPLNNPSFPRSSYTTCFNCCAPLSSLPRPLFSGIVLAAIQHGSSHMRAVDKSLWRTQIHRILEVIAFFKDPLNSSSCKLRRLEVREGVSKVRRLGAGCLISTKNDKS